MKTLKILFFFIVQFFVCLILVEGVSYIFLLKTSNPLYRARRILNYDSASGWYQKPSLNTKFDGAIVTTDSNGFRVKENDSRVHTSELLILGPSSAFGWGVDFNSTYSSIVAEYLQATTINASGIGHSILQGEIIWDKYFSKDTTNIKYALISYGINDLDKYRFFDSEPIDDKIFFQNPPLALSIDKLNINSNFIMTLSLVMREIEYKNNCSQLSHSVQRVSWDDFKKSLDQVTLSMKKRNITPVIIGTAYYLKQVNPNYSPDKILLAYEKVNKLAQDGSCDKAYDNLKIAKSYEPDDIYKKVLELNENLKNYAAASGLVFIDSFNLLNSAAPAENYFDPVHPSSKGHLLIATQIIDSLGNKQR